jgi:hypothetical protein
VVAVNAVGTSCKNNELAAPFVGDYCSGLIIHRNDPSHPESAAAMANPQLAIDYIAVGEPPFVNNTNNFMFKMKVSNLTIVPPNSRWRIVWDSFSSPGQQYYVGMNSDSMGAASFVYGTIATAVVGLVVGVPQETQVGTALAQSNFQPDGTITIYVPKSAVGNPQPGDLLGAVNGRTFSDNSNLERSTALIDHTFVKAQTDTGYPAATYTVAGTPPPTSYALSTLGAIATGSTTFFNGGYPASSAIDGDRTGNTWGLGTGGWNDGTFGVWPDSLAIDLNGSRTISEIRVYTLQNNWTTAGEPNTSTTATGEGILDFEVQYWNGSAFVTIPSCNGSAGGCNVTGNDKAMRVFTLDTPITTTKIQVKVNNGRNNYSRIVEVEAACNCAAIP